MSTVPCRNGAACTRPGCWYAHPDGHSVPGGASSSGPSFAPAARNTHYGGGPARGGAAAAGQANPGNVCRFGRGCHREGCYYSHPEGRDIDEGGAPGAISAGPGAKRSPAPVSPHSGRSDFNGDEWEEEMNEEQFIAAQGGIQACECCGGKPLECQAPACKAQGKCGCSLGDGPEDEEDDSLRDEWFPAHRDCPCCAGTIYRCQKQQSDCVSGQCFCSLQKVTASSS